MRKLFLLVPLLVACVSGIAADLEIVVPTGSIQPGQHYLLEVHGLTSEDLPTSKILVEPIASTKAVGVTGWAGEQYLWFVASEKGRHFVAVIVVRDGLPVSASAVIQIGDKEPPPPDPNLDITEKSVKEWLEEVPESAKSEEIENPVTGEKFTRQEAVGKTFTQIGEKASSLKSIRAMNVMLTTGLVAAFGSKANQWRAFATNVDAALASLEKKGVLSSDYGKALLVIGSALQ